MDKDLPCDLQPVSLATLVYPQLETMGHRLFLIPGDLQLSSFEDQLSKVWPECLDGDEHSFRVTSALWRFYSS